MAQDLSGTDERRWPRIAPAAVELGFPAVLALQLPATTGLGAALDPYGGVADSSGFDDLDLADIFVGHLPHLLFGEAAHAAVPAGEQGCPGEEHELRQRLDRPTPGPRGATVAAGVPRPDRRGSRSAPGVIPAGGGSGATLRPGP